MSDLLDSTTTRTETVFDVPGARLARVDGSQRVFRSTSFTARIECVAGRIVLAVFDGPEQFATIDVCAVDGEVTEAVSGRTARWFSVDAGDRKVTLGRLDRARAALVVAAAAAFASSGAAAL